MAEQDSTPTRFYIEALRRVVHVNNMSGRLGKDWDNPFDAWVPVGSITIEPGEFGALTRDAFTAWEGEQEPRPPVGAYRVWHHETYAIVAQQFEITDRIEREITRVESPLEQQLKEDITTLSIAALTPADGEGTG